MPKDRPSFANRLCRDAGHDWMCTTAANYRVCKREQCRASERLVEGRWVSNARAYRLHDPLVEYGKRHRQPRQLPMWATTEPHPFTQSYPNQSPTQHKEV